MNRGPGPRRHDSSAAEHLPARPGRAGIDHSAGEIDPATAPQLRAVLERCAHDGITTIDVDLTTVDRCDSSGLRVFLDASRHAAETHASLRLHYPSPQTARLLADMGSDLLLL
ncbi:STAS domain-containing protein [Streptomyces qaidamensis]|uniref:STAS domain-containing protein n=1 Tax=Streptomyces qaidamensis TaxID=1783515 RepID=UPI00364B2309